MTVRLPSFITVVRCMKFYMGVYDKENNVLVLFQVDNLHVIYLDTNVYCRSRDDRSQKRIDREAEAFEEIAKLKEEGKLIIISSDYVKMELRE